MPLPRQLQVQVPSPSSAAAPQSMQQHSSHTPLFPLPLPLDPETQKDRYSQSIDTALSILLWSKRRNTSRRQADRQTARMIRSTASCGDVACVRKVLGPTPPLAPLFRQSSAEGRGKAGNNGPRGDDVTVGEEVGLISVVHCMMYTASTVGGFAKTLLELSLIVLAYFCIRNERQRGGAMKRNERAHTRNSGTWKLVWDDHNVGHHLDDEAQGLDEPPQTCS